MLVKQFATNTWVTLRSKLADSRLKSRPSAKSDAELFRAALNPLVVAKDGQRTIQYLSGEPPYNDRTQHPFPGLLPLDLNLLSSAVLRS